jgi:DNA-binding PadR family transcriptional regulator
VAVNDPAILILASLAGGDKHGYAIMADVEQFAGVRLGAGTLYGAITRLEASGWITGLEGEERRKPYRLTAPGRRQLEEQISGLTQVVKTAARRLRHA